MRSRNATSILPLILALLLAACGESAAGPSDGAQLSRQTAPRGGFGFNGIVSGFPTGIVRLSGGGAFVAPSAPAIAPSDASHGFAGGFSCVRAVGQGPLAGCAEGEGVRWDTARVLASTGFKCTGSDAVKSAVTGDGTIVLLANLYRAGDGDEASFHAQIIVSDGDLAPELPGEQNLWIQGVGCGAANGA
jgi:hypothetical protein